MNVTWHWGGRFHRIWMTIKKIKWIWNIFKIIINLSVLQVPNPKYFPNLEVKVWPTKKATVKTSHWFSIKATSFMQVVVGTLLKTWSGMMSTWQFSSTLTSECGFHALPPHSAYAFGDSWELHSLELSLLFFPFSSAYLKIFTQFIIFMRLYIIKIITINMYSIHMKIYDINRIKVNI